MDLWVFAYGSLIWRPGFRFEEASHALLEGAHRALCVYSVVHRGAPAAPGLVFGLDKGGTCEGLVFRVPKRWAADTRAYLARRENVTNTYHATMRPVKLLDSSNRTVNALCFFVDRRNPQYAGRLPLEVQSWLVRRSAGKSGANIDYVVNTMLHLRELGVYDHELERVMSMLGHGIMKTRCKDGKGAAPLSKIVLPQRASRVPRPSQSLFAKRRDSAADLKSALYPPLNEAAASAI